MVPRRTALWLVFAFSAALALWTGGPGWPWREDLFIAGGLSREGLAAGRWWTWLTHAFLHGSWWHALFNLLSLWFVGKHLCDRYGQGFFLALFGAGALAGGLAQLAVLSDAVLIGLSGGIMAMITCAAFLWDDRPVGFGFATLRLGEVKGKFLGWGVLGAALGFAFLSPWMPEGGIAIGHACHAGAAVCGAMIAWGARAVAPYSSVPPVR